MPSTRAAAPAWNITHRARIQKAAVALHPLDPCSAVAATL
jgi:hypothetical protein